MVVAFRITSSTSLSEFVANALAVGSGKHEPRGLTGSILGPRALTSPGSPSCPMPTQHGRGQGSPAAQGALVVGVLVGSPWSGWERTQLSQTAAVTPSVPASNLAAPSLGRQPYTDTSAPVGLELGQRVGWGCWGLWVGESDPVS